MASLRVRSALGLLWSLLPRQLYRAIGCCLLFLVCYCCSLLSAPAGQKGPNCKAAVAATICDFYCCEKVLVVRVSYPRQLAEQARVTGRCWGDKSRGVFNGQQARRGQGERKEEQDAIMWHQTLLICMCVGRCQAAHHPGPSRVGVNANGVLASSNKI